MQQAYRVLRVVAEAQTIRIVLAPSPNELMLKELASACGTLKTENSRGIKAMVLDFKSGAGSGSATDEAPGPAIISQACTAVQAVEAPVLAVVRGALSPAACSLVQVADLILVGNDAVLTWPRPDNAEDRVKASASNGSAKPLVASNPYTGAQALRLRLVNWSVPIGSIDGEMERILDMLREKSAIALRLVKASVRLGKTQAPEAQQAEAQGRLEALRRVNEFYLAEVMKTADASEGLHAFLEKRKPQWKNQ